MSKILLSALFMILSAPVLACKPGPLPECKVQELIIREKDFAELLEQVSDYQKLLDKEIVPPEMRHSCFNNHFAVYFGGLFKEALKRNHGRTCPVQLKIVEETMRDLLSQESEEFKSVKKPGAKKSLTEMGIRLTDEIEKFFP